MNEIINENRDVIEAIMNDREAKMNEINALKDKLNRAKIELDTLEKMLPYFGGKCPTCGTLGNVRLVKNDEYYFCQFCD